MPRAPKPKIKGKVVSRSTGYETSFAASNHVFVRQGYTLEELKDNNIDADFERETRKNIVQSMWAYKKFGVIRNAIDIIGDFASDGIQFVAKTEKDQRFIDRWAEKIKRDHVSERFCNLLARSANILVHRSFAKISISEKKRMSAEGEIKIKTNRIPWSYAINSPLNLTIKNGESALYFGSVQYSALIPSFVTDLYKSDNPKKAEQLNVLPKAMIDALKRGEKSYPLDEQTDQVYTYKKDDFEIWAEPLISGILDDITMLAKMKQADFAVMNGFINKRTLWNMGHPDKGIFPTQDQIDDLTELLQNGNDGGPQDIIWSFALDFKEGNTEHYKVLTSEKYGSTYRAIYEGLGLPYVMTTGEGTPASNLSVKVMLKRIEYIRKVLTSFWLKELKEVEKACGLTPGIEITYSHINLSDPTAELALYIQLVDRNLISIQTLQERFGEKATVELMRQNREQKQIDGGKRVRKASQWHNPEHKEALQKSALSTGQATPAEVGLELLPNAKGQKRVVDINAQAKKEAQQKKVPGESGQGRPTNSKDKTKRTRSTKAFIQALAENKKRFEEVSQFITPSYLQMVDKKNVRSLTEAEFAELERLKFGVFSCQGSRTVEETVLAGDAKDNPKVEKAFSQLCNKKDGKLTVEEERELKIAAFTMCN